MIAISKLSCLVILMSAVLQVAAQNSKLRIAVAGTSHGHSGWILGRPADAFIEVVGIYETNPVLVKNAIRQNSRHEKIIFNDLNKMLDATRPEAVVAFGSIYEHLQVVEACAPRGIHVMVEKPLAVSVEHATKMEALAQKHNIHLLTNYETSWYPATIKAGELINDSNYTGGLLKAVFHHGHEGPKEIGVSKEFFDWLTDPVQNGGGALIDFGCYGANLMTWLMKNQVPVSVKATTRQFKPHIYPKVDDEATIIVDYPGAQAIIQASWNWPYNRKDMELYGKTGFIAQLDNTHMKIKQATDSTPVEKLYTAADVSVYTDPFLYLHDVIRGKVKTSGTDLYSLANNMIVVRILEAARQSAQTGKTVYLK